MATPEDTHDRVHIEPIEPPVSAQGGDLRGFTRRNGQAPLDVGTCVNKHGPHPEVLRALAAITADGIRAHPYSDADDFGDAYLRFVGVDAHPGQVLVGAGITAFLRILARVDVPACTIFPDYTETISRFPVRAGSPTDTWQSRAARIDEAMAAHRLVVISNPCNPLGTVIPPGVLLRIAGAHPQAMLVIDEAYAEFLPGQLGRGLLGADAPNIAVLRSPNKILGAAGLRVGMMWTRHPVLHAHMAAELPRWPISHADARAAIAGLTPAPTWTGNSGAHPWIDHTRREILTVAGWMETALRARFGDAVLPSPLHFRFVHLPDPTLLDTVWRHFGERNIAVRAFPVGEHDRAPGLRFVAPTAADWPQLADAIATAP